MRVFTCVCLLFILAGCAAPGQTTSERSLPAVTSPPAPAQPSAAPTLVERTATPGVTQPAATPLPGSSVLLTLHNPNENRDEIHLVNPESGQDVPGYRPFVAAPYRLSPDGKQLVAIESRGQSCEASGGGTACRGSADVLHLIDLQSWREITATLSAQGWAGPSSFSSATL